MFVAPCFYRQSSSSRSLSESLHDSPFIDASPSKSNLAPASSQSAAPTVDFTGLGWRPCPATRSHATTANIGAAIESLGIGSLSNDVASIPRTDTASIVDGAAAAGSMGLSLGSDVDIASVTLGSSSTTLADEFSLGVANASPNRAAITATQAASTPPDMARLLDGTGGNDNAHTTVNPLEASTPSRSGVRKSASSGDTLLGSPPSPVLNGSSTGPTDGTSSSLPITGSKPGSSSPPAPRVADVLKRNHRSGSLPLVGGSAPLSVPVSTVRFFFPHCVCSCCDCPATLCHVMRCLTLYAGTCSLCSVVIVLHCMQCGCSLCSVVIVLHCMQCGYCITVSSHTG